jgi:hypothetical protein
MCKFFSLVVQPNFPLLFLNSPCVTAICSLRTLPPLLTGRLFLSVPVPVPVPVHAPHPLLRVRGQEPRIIPQSWHFTN